MKGTQHNEEPEDPAVARKKKKAKDYARLVDAARIEMVNRAGWEFIQSIEGGVPTPEQAQAGSFVVQFKPGPLSWFENKGCKFCEYFVWKDTHCMAFGFLDAQHPTDLSVCRVPRELFPAALAAYIHNRKQKQNIIPS